jgi:hypothetical protein
MEPLQTLDTEDLASASGGRFTIAGGPSWLANPMMMFSMIPQLFMPRHDAGQDMMTAVVMAKLMQQNNNNAG